MGLRLRDLGTDALWWRDLLVIVDNLPVTSALHRKVSPEWAAWAGGDVSAHLLAVIADGVTAGNWMQSKDGQKNRNRPKPIPRPGLEPDSKRYGGKAETVDSIRDWLGWGDQPKPARARDARGRFTKTK